MFLKFTKIVSVAILVIVGLYVGLVWQFPEFFTRFKPKINYSEHHPGPVPVDLSTLEEDQFLVVTYRLSPVLVTRASKQRMKQLTNLNGKTLNGTVIEEHSSNIFVLSQASPYRGCIVEELHNELGGWPGGFLDTCYGLVFDYAGRALSAELHSQIKSRVKKYPDMKSVEFQINEDDNKIYIGKKAL